MFYLRTHIVLHPNVDKARVFSVQIEKNDDKINGFYKCGRHVYESIKFGVAFGGFHMRKTNSWVTWVL